MTRFLPLFLVTALAAPALAWEDPDCMRDYEQEVDAIRAEYAEWAESTEDDFRELIAQYGGQLGPQQRAALRYELEASLAQIRAERDEQLAAFELAVCPGECEDLNGDGICDDECIDANGNGLCENECYDDNFVWQCECADTDGDGVCDECYDDYQDRVPCQLP